MQAGIACSIFLCKIMKSVTSTHRISWFLFYHFFQLLFLWNLVTVHNFSSEHTAYSPAEGLRVGSCILINYLLNLVSNSREIRYVTSMRITPATTSYITCCFVVNVDMNTAIAQIQKVVRIHCGTFLLPRMPI